MDADGNISVVWIDSHEAWEDGYLTPTDNWDLRLRTATLPADTTPRVTKHYYANDQRIASRVDGDLYYILGDHLGSTSLVVDESGVEQGHVIYDAYGQVVENTLSEGLTDRLFTGQVLDPTGLYYYNARYYDPLVGQFTQPDSVVADPLNPAAWNRYSYVYNSPSNYVDPSGHCPLCIVAIGASIFGGGSAIIYTATHPGSSFDRAEYLDTVLRWTLRGGVIGAAASVIGPKLLLLSEPVMFGAEFGSTATTLFNAGLTSGFANVILTGIAQGGYGDFTQIENAFYLGFYPIYGLGVVSAGAARLIGIPRDAIWRRAFVTGTLGAGYEALKGETRPAEIGINFAAYFTFGLFSPSINNTARRLAYGLLRVPMPSPNPISMPGVGRYIGDYVAEGLGYTISSLAVTGTKPGMLKLYRQWISELRQ